MVIDSHHHLWRYTDADYAWIPPDWGALRRDFFPADLQREMNAAGVDGAIAVHARQSLVETCWLLGLASRHDFIRGVVGWAPLADPAIEDILTPLAAHPKLRGIRHVLHDEPDPRYMLRDDFNRGIRALSRRGLIYELLVFARHLPDVIAFVDQHPGQRFVVDHIAKPRIRAGELEPWATDLRELARRPNVVGCKLSGMVTEAEVKTWTPDQLRPFADRALEIFGPDRLLWGSDWPVCLAAVDYPRWKQTAEAWFAKLTRPERDAIFGGNASRIYELPPSPELKAAPPARG